MNVIVIEVSVEEVKELVKSTEVVDPIDSIIEAVLNDILNDIEEKEQQSMNPIDQFLQAISVGSATPRSISTQELYNMITDKRHELITLHAAYGNCVSLTEQSALQRRIESASKDLNTLMTMAQCR